MVTKTMNTQDVRNRIESVLNDLESGIRLIDQAQKQIESNNNLQISLISKEKNIQDKYDKYIQESKILDLEKSRISKLLEDIAMREVLLKRADKVKTDNEQLLTKITKEKEEIGSISREIEKKRQEYTILDQRKRELDHRESLLQKEMLADQHRKEYLDKQEEIVKKEQERLQKLSEELDKLQLKLNAV